MLLGLRTAIYPAHDMAAAKAWYSRVLDTAPYYDQPYYIGFSVGGFELGLLPDAQSSRDGVQAYWGVDNIVDAQTRLLELGASEAELPKDVGEGIQVASVLDPFGNRLYLIQNPYFDRQAVR